MYVETIPIPKRTPSEQRLLVRLVDRIIAAKDVDIDANVAAEEKEIDRLVYELYGLNRQEIAAVEGVARS